MLSRQPLTKLELESKQESEPSGHVRQGPRQGEGPWTIVQACQVILTWDIIWQPAARLSPRDKKHISRTQVEYPGAKVLEEPLNHRLP